MHFSPDGRRLAMNSFDGEAGWIDVAGGGATTSLGEGGGWALAFAQGGASCYRRCDRKRGWRRARSASKDTATGRTLWSTPGWRISLSRDDGTRIAVDRGQPLPWVPARGGGGCVGYRVAPDRLGHRWRLPAGGCPQSGRQADRACRSRRLGAPCERGRAAASLQDSPPAGRSRWWPFPLTGDSWLPAAWAKHIFGASETSHPRRQAAPSFGCRVWAVAFSPDNTKLATTCSDRAIRIWDTATESMPAHPAGPL